MVIDKPVVFLVPCFSSQAIHSIHTGTCYKIFQQEGEEIFSLELIKFQIFIEAN